MTLRELYQEIGGDYDQAARVLRVEKLIDKHIRKFNKNGVVEQLLEAGRSGDANRIFEAAHAAKGVCGNLGLKALSEMAYEIAEEYRPGNARALTDDQVAAKLEAIAETYRRADAGIRKYEE